MSHILSLNSLLNHILRSSTQIPSWNISKPSWTYDLTGNVSLSKCCYIYVPFFSPRKINFSWLSKRIFWWKEEGYVLTFRIYLHMLNDAHKRAYVFYKWSEILFIGQVVKKMYHWFKYVIKAARFASSNQWILTFTYCTDI